MDHMHPTACKSLILRARQAARFHRRDRSRYTQTGNESETLIQGHHIMRSHAHPPAIPLLVLTATWVFAPTTCSGIGYDGGTQNGGIISCPSTTCSAQIVPAGDFRGKSLDQWGLDYQQWGLKTGLGGQTLPDTVDGVRFLPPNLGSEFVANLTIQQGTPLVFLPFNVFGEIYDNGTQDNPNDPVIDEIFETSTIRTTFNGNVVLEGLASEFPDRTFGVTVFDEPILYAQPQPRGFGLNSVTAIFGTGITAIFDMLPLGQHTIAHVYNSPFFGGTFTATYNITVAPGLPGDFNHDGSVDAADDVVWRKDDINGQPGYGDWRANFGRTAASGSAPQVRPPLSLAPWCPSLLHLSCSLRSWLAAPGAFSAANENFNFPVTSLVVSESPLHNLTELPSARNRGPGKLSLDGPSHSRSTQ
jgi:hypothetical protein